MIASVSPEADLELTESAVSYAREGGAEVGLAFIAEYELEQPAFDSRCHAQLRCATRDRWDRANLGHALVLIL